MIRQHCATEGTDYDRIRKTILYGALHDPESQGPDFVEQMRVYQGIGIDEVHVMPPGNDPVGFIEGLGKHVVPALHDV